MTDLVERLRANAKSEDCLYDMDPDLLYAAADEIERLQSELAALKSQNRKLISTLEGIANADWRKWDEEMRSEREFVIWAKSRASRAIAPKPGELAALKSQGSVAWADVPDATAWLEDLRGNAPTPPSVQVSDLLEALIRLSNAMSNPGYDAERPNALLQARAAIAKAAPKQGESDGLA